MSDHPAAATLRHAVQMLEADHDGSAIASLNHARTLLASTSGGAIAAVHGAIEAFDRGDDRTALTWARTALARLA